MDYEFDSTELCKKLDTTVFDIAQIYSFEKENFISDTTIDQDLQTS